MPDAKGRVGGRLETLQTGDAVIFQREPRAPWETGEYVCRVSPAVNDWHRVRAHNGFRDVFVVPPRRIKKVELAQ